MKIKVFEKSYDEVLKIPEVKHKKPRKPGFLIRTLAKILSDIELRSADFSFSGKLPDKSEGPCLILMNHSSFIDLKIAEKLLYPRPFSIICAHDALVGKAWLMRWLGCIPTKKFVADLSLIRDIKTVIGKGQSVLMYPEAGYSFDGRSTTLPSYLSGLIRMLKVNVVYIETRGAFTMNPLYNELRQRKVPVSAEIKTLFTKEECSSLSDAEIGERIKTAFAFDNFAWQRDSGIKVTEDFRATGLERILYRCPACGKEGNMKGEGIKLTCAACGKTYTLTELGEISADNGKTEFSHIPDWFDFERKCAREELLAPDYSLNVPVNIGIMKDYKGIYMVGEGTLTHTAEGFWLTGCEGKLNFHQKAIASYSVNADFFWYEIGDTVSLGDMSILYYCFPKDNTPVAKIRLLAEELYKLHQDRDFHLLHCGGCDHSHHEEDNT